MVEVIKKPDVIEWDEKRRNDLAPLFERMDKSRDLLYMKDYKLPGFDGKPLKNVVNVTLNTPAVFANTMIADLLGALFQIQVEGELSRTTVKVLESFLEDAQAQGDEQLLESRGLVSLKSWLASHVVARSLIGVRVITQIVDGEYKVNLLPMDMRYVAWEFGTSGLNRFSYETTRDQRLIYDQYGIAVENQTAKCLDYWDDKYNRVIIDGKELEGTFNINGVKTTYPQKHQFGYAPGIIVLPSAGFMMQDEGFIEHEAEDILFLDKKLYDESNRIASIIQTKAMETVRPPYEYEVKDYDATPPDPPPSTGQTQKRKEGERHQLLERPDLTPAIQAGQNLIDKGVQEGGYNSIDLGNAPGNETAIWITTQNEIRKKFLRPRLEALEVFYAKYCRMLIDQYKTICKDENAELKVGSTGRRRGYRAVTFSDPTTYRIKARVMSRNKVMEVANATLALSLWEKLPEKWILENILYTDNPERVLSEMSMQRARRLDPSLDMLHMAVNYANEAKDLDGQDAELAKIMSIHLTDSYVNMKRQQTAQPQIQTDTNKQPNVSALAALNSRGGSVTDKIKWTVEDVLREAHNALRPPPIQKSVISQFLGQIKQPAQGQQLGIGNQPMQVKQTPNVRQ
jgi:hypothetical protein